jgi:hypothetical protein
LPEGVGAGDHQHRHQPLDRVGRLRAGGEPADERDGPGHERDDGEPEGGPVGERLRPGAGGLGLRHEPHDAREGRLVSRSGDPEP